MEQVFDLPRMVAHVIKSAKERGAEILRFFKESIVCNVLAGVIPNTLGRIEFWPVGRKLEDFHKATVRFEPIVDHLLQKCQIGFPLEIILLMKVDETGIVQTDRAENLLCMALPLASESGVDFHASPRWHAG